MLNEGNKAIEKKNNFLIDLQTTVRDATAHPNDCL